MDQNTFFVVVSIGVFVAAFALIFQAAMLYGTYKASRALHDSVVPLVPKVEALVASSRAAVEESRTTIAEISAKTNRLLDAAQRQMECVEELLEDASARTRRQLERAELALDDALARAQETVALVHKGVLKPIRGINGVAAGVRAALHFLLRGSRPSPDQVTVDEEMFI